MLLYQKKMPSVTTNSDPPECGSANLHGEEQEQNTAQKLFSPFSGMGVKSGLLKLKDKETEGWGRGIYILAGLSNRRMQKTAY